MFTFLKNSRDILGMNCRNLSYIRPLNLKKSRRLADSKLLCKKVLKKNGLSVPGLIAKIKSYEELESFDWNTLPASFALKPNRGFGGEGILVVYGKKKDLESTWIKADGSLVTLEDVKNQIRNILDGSFSLSNTPDTAFFEERLQLLKLFKPYAYKGIPDIRVIIYNKVPVMAMLRLPTKESGGKANLQQGAIGVGIDLATGITTTAVQGKSKIIEKIPESRLLVSGIKIPHWQDILLLAIKTQEISHLGFLGVDVAIDKERGPVILELNARPGLSIQLANFSGLKERLRRVAGLKIKTAEKGMRMGMDMFGGEIEEELESISGRKIVGIKEKVKIVGLDKKIIEIEAKVDTGAYSSSIDTGLAIDLGFENLLNYFNSLTLPVNFSREDAKNIEAELRKKYLGSHPDLADISIVYSASGVSIRPKVNLTFNLADLEIVTQVNIIARENLQNSMIIGRRNLKRFLVDVNKIKDKKL
jgi:alpha-L-glutamate ligase-like protein